MDSRFFAVKSLIKIVEHKSDFDSTINSYQDKFEHFGEFYNIVSGVIKFKLKLDFFIEKISSRKKLSPPVKNILRAGLFELEFTKNPDYAVINSYVEIAKTYDKNSTGFINAVFRNYLRKKDEIELPDKEKFPEKHLSIKYSHPEWLVTRWIKEFGAKNTELICEYNNTPPELSIRVNILKTNSLRLQELFAEKGVKFTVGKFSQNILTIENSGNIKKLPAYSEGLWSVQGEASELVSRVLAPEKNQKILDVCASPGGKTTHIAELIENCGEVFAIDLNDKKTSRIKENCERLGISCVKTIICDAKKLCEKEEFKNIKFDRILIDAPCSNTGVLGKKADVRWNKSPQDIEALSKIQAEILKSASKFLKSGGILVYSTCSIEKEENILQIQKFLEENLDFKLESFPETIEFLDKKSGHVQILPFLHKTDGFFIARLKKI